MLLYSQTHLHNLLDRLETSDARTTGQLEALTVWVAALVQSHPAANTANTAQADRRFAGNKGEQCITAF